MILMRFNDFPEVSGITSKRSRRVWNIGRFFLHFVMLRDDCMAQI